MTPRFIGRRTASLLVALPLALLFYAAARRLDITAIDLPTPPRSGNVHLAATAARPVFTHAVIPGGAYSAEELRDAFQRDAVVAAHYRDVDPRDVRLTVLSKGKAAYVSYRVGNRIYWTRNRVWIAPGESVLTDGAVQIRARCGNCISDTPGEVAAVEPASGVLDDSVIPPTDEPRVAGFAAEAESDLGDLLAIPFGPQAFASFTPQVSAFTGDNPLPLWPQPAPWVVLPGSAGGGGMGGVPGGPDDVPGGGSSPPPAPFVPGGGTTTGSTSSGSTSGSSGTTTGGSVTTTTGSSSGTPTTGTTGSATTGASTTSGASDTTGTPSTTTTGATSTGSTTSTGWPGDTTGSPTGSSTTGSLTTGDTTSGDTTGILTTNGSPTSGVSGSTSTGQHEAPEPSMLWLVALGGLGLANRAWRRWR